MFLSNNPLSGDINSSNLSCFVWPQLRFTVWLEYLHVVCFDFSLTVKAAPHECVIRTGQP